MLLNELVEINQKGNLRSSVDLGFLDDSELNRDLCESFIFSFDSQDPKRSTLGILDLVRESFHSANKPNIHLMVQQYGKGKSHFALAVANYFKKGFGSPEVEAILHQAEASSGNDSPIANRLRAYKKNHDQHLVIRLRGDQAGNIRQQFLTELLQSLKEANITDTVAQHFCAEPLKFLQERILPNANHREIAEEYLGSQGNEDGGLREIIKALENNNANVVKHAIGITKAVMGITPNFDTEIDIEKILTDIINNHCRGENPDFQGILIIFDELMAYLKNFSQDSQGSGGMALQNITTVCEKNRSHIALISFSPISLEITTGIPAGQLEDYRKLAGRLSPKAETYNNVPSSLELVLSNIVLQTKNNTLWSEFRQRWDTTLSSQTEMAYTKVMAPVYRNKFSDKSKFHSTVTLGTFPLHPLCTYLLCNIDFVQVVARNSIQFVREYATRFIDSTPAETSGRLNQIYAIEVLKAFHDSFTDSPMYSDYAKARDGIAASATSEELDVLGALFLFYAAGEKLSKADRDPHEPILEALSGIPENKIKEIMKRFSKFIYFDSTRRQYRFFEGTSPGDILKRVKVAVAKDISDNPDLPLEKTLSECQGKVTTYLKSDTLYSSDFVVSKSK
ncbi:MAG: hypothetical protein HC921_20205, partial [Synechococcaceae cyanobacterium SM2_3_1]|nr:hypothetical protein [Synechococcaceae cyanobacterium SM2_3_1]